MTFENGVSAVGWRPGVVSRPAGCPNAWAGRAPRGRWAGVVLAMLAPQVAAAAPGEHIQVSDTTVITPEIAAGLEFRTNSFLSIGGVQSAFPRDQAVPSLNFVLRPHLAIDHKSDKAKFSFDGYYELRKWFDPQLAQSLDRFSDFQVDTRLDALPKAVVGVSIRDSAVIRNRENDSPYLGNALVTQVRNDIGAGIVVRPGPEFDIEPNFGWAWHDYRVPGADDQRVLNTRNTFSPGLNINWRFYPNTAFVVETSYQLNRWATNWMPTDQQVPIVESGVGAIRSYGEYLAMPDSDFFKGMTGIRGRFTRNLVMQLMLGWGSGRYSAKSVEEESAADPGIGDEADPEATGFGQNIKGIDGLLAVVKVDADLGYGESRRFGQKVGFLYRKDFQDSFFTNYVHQNQLKVGLDSRWGRYLSSNLGVGVRFEEYRGEVDRRDIFLKLDFGVRVSPTRYLGVDLGGFWAQRASSQAEVQYDNVSGRVMLTFTY
jgi:hypothetical protein